VPLQRLVVENRFRVVDASKLPISNLTRV